MMTNDDKKNAENAEIFSCNFCDFICSKKSDFNRHISTRKHKMMTNDDAKNAENAEKFKCDCGKQYSYRQGLYVHKKKCNFKELVQKPEIKEEELDYKSLFLQALKQMEKKDELMSSMIDKIGTTNNTTNNTINNQSVNINLFLNEKCKDAINFSDFIERIEVSRNDLENNAQLGFVNGITKIFMDNLNQLTLYERPIHCTDIKRETLYIKDSDKWEKEQSAVKLNSAIQEVSRKSIGSLLHWKQTNPEYENMDSAFSNKCLVMQKESIAGDKKDNYYNKIIHNLAKENKI